MHACDINDSVLEIAREKPIAPGKADFFKADAITLAGVPVVLTDTPGQRPLAASLGEGGIVYMPGDVAALAEQLRAG